MRTAKDDDYKATVDVGLAAETELRKLKPQQQLAFKAACRQFLVTMCAKLVERSPIQFKIVEQVRSSYSQHDTQCDTNLIIYLIL